MQKEFWFNEAFLPELALLFGGSDDAGHHWHAKPLVVLTQELFCQGIWFRTLFVTLDPRSELKTAKQLFYLKSHLKRWLLSWKRPSDRKVHVGLITAKAQSKAIQTFDVWEPIHDNVHLLCNILTISKNRISGSTLINSCLYLKSIKQMCVHYITFSFTLWNSPILPSVN